MERVGRDEEREIRVWEGKRKSIIPLTTHPLKK